MATPNGVNGEHSLPALSTSAEDFLNHNFDYVIVGGGTAGLVIAARLTENPDISVGVLEAGKNRLNDFLVDCPATFSQMYNNPEYDWAFMSEPQKHNHDKVHHIVRGKGLGGSSLLNYMMYVRGSLQDFDDWGIICDDPSWNSEKMAEYMRKHQTLEPIDESVVDRATLPFVGEFHGTSGPVRTSFNSSFLPIEHDWIKACDEVTGYKKKPLDPWSGDHLGFYNTLGLVARSGPNKGKRSYAARGYFEANATRPNLHVLCEALVTAVQLDGDKATGVNFQYGGKDHTVGANREVVVSCGSLQSPQILELSGIGDPHVLKAAGVDCKIENRAVGENLQDHSIAGISYEVKPGVPTLQIIYQPEVMEAAQQEYGEKQSGPLTHIASTQGFLPWKRFANDAEQKEVYKTIEDSFPSLTPFQRKQYERALAHLKSDQSANLQCVLMPSAIGWAEGIQDQSKLLPPWTPGTPMAITGAMCLQYPLSRGTVHIKSSSPSDHPVIDPKYMSHPADAAVLAAGLKMVDKVFKTDHLADKVVKQVAPSAEKDMSDTQQAKDWAYEWTMSEYHPVGTCAMGAAVDSRLRVKGARNLRVVDASVIPHQVSGNIVSSVYALAEKGADLIKEDWDYAALAKAT